MRRMRWKWWKKERSPKKEQVIIPMLLWTNCCSMWKSVIHVPYTTHMEDCHDMFLRCREKSCPTFCDLKDYDYFYHYYYYGCRQQGHPWYTLDTISRMVCLSQTGVIKRCIWDVLRGIAIYSNGGVSNHLRKHNKFCVLTWNDIFCRR